MSWQEDSDVFHADCAERGRELILAGVYYDANQVEWFDRNVVHLEEQELLERQGCCSRCGPGEIMNRRCGDQVCRWTNLPCKKIEIAEILKLYEGVFDECSSN